MTISEFDSYYLKIKEEAEKIKEKKATIEATSVWLIMLYSSSHLICNYIFEDISSFFYFENYFKLYWILIRLR